MKVSYSGEILPVDSYIEGSVYLSTTNDRIGLSEYRCGKMCRMDRPKRFVFYNLSTNVGYLIDGDCLERFMGAGKFIDYTDRTIYSVARNRWRPIMELDRRFTGFKAISGQLSSEPETLPMSDIDSLYHPVVDWEEVYDICSLFDPETGRATLMKEGFYHLDITIPYRLDSLFSTSVVAPRFILVKNTDEIIGSATIQMDDDRILSIAQVNIISDYHLCPGDTLRLYYTFAQPTTIDISTLTPVGGIVTIDGDYDNLVITGSAPGVTVDLQASVSGNVLVTDATMDRFIVTGPASVDGTIMFQDSTIIDPTPTTGDGAVQVGTNANPVDNIDIGVLSGNRVEGGFAIYTEGENNNVKVCGTGNTLGTTTGNLNTLIFVTDGDVSLCSDGNSFTDFAAVDTGNIYICGNNNSIGGANGPTVVTSGNIVICGYGNTITAGRPVATPDNVYICSDGNTIQTVVTASSGTAIDAGGDVFMCGNNNTVTSANEDGINANNVSVCGTGNTVTGGPDVDDYAIEATGTVNIAPGNPGIDVGDIDATTITQVECTSCPCPKVPCNCQSPDANIYPLLKIEPIWSLHLLS